jgi:MEMO1 family protein
VAIGTLRYEELCETGVAISNALAEADEEIVMVTSSDMNHYEDDETTRRKDEKAIECMLKMDAKGLYHVCRAEQISMCGLGPAVTMLTAMNRLGAQSAELVRYATSGDVTGNRNEVVGYAGMIFV